MHLTVFISTLDGLKKLCKVFAKFLKTSQIIISPFIELQNSEEILAFNNHLIFSLLYLIMDHYKVRNRNLTQGSTSTFSVKVFSLTTFF